MGMETGQAMLHDGLFIILCEMLWVAMLHDT